MDDASYEFLFKPIMDKVVEVYDPEAIVLQCGADSLAGDRLGVFNLSIQGHAECIRHIKSFGRPLMVLGGGGYTIRNVARCWTYETAVLLEQDLPDQLPDNPYREYFGPDYQLRIPVLDLENQNTRQSLEELRNRVLENLQRIASGDAAGTGGVAGAGGVAPNGGGGWGDLPTVPPRMGLPSELAMALRQAVPREEMEEAEERAGAAASMSSGRVRHDGVDLGLGRARNGPHVLEWSKDGHMSSYEGGAGRSGSDKNPPGPSGGGSRGSMSPAPLGCSGGGSLSSGGQDGPGQGQPAGHRGGGAGGAGGDPSRAVSRAGPGGVPMALDAATAAAWAGAAGLREMANGVPEEQRMDTGPGA